MMHRASRDTPMDYERESMDAQSRAAFLAKKKREDWSPPPQYESIRPPATVITRRSPGPFTDSSGLVAVEGANVSSSMPSEAEGNAQRYIKEQWLDVCSMHFSQYMQEGASTTSLSSVLVDVSDNARGFNASVKAMLSSKDAIARMMQLTGETAKCLIDILDYTLTSMDIDSQQYQTAFHCLRKLCARHGYLPSSFTLPSETLRLTGERPEGSGSFADVWRGQYNDRPVAFKAIRVTSKSDLQNVVKTFCKEAVTWKYLTHPNVTQFLGIDTTHFRFCMVSAWMPRGNMNAFISENPDAHRTDLVLDVAEGLHYLHYFGVVHGDLKGPNILVSEDGHACLSDFGLTSFIYNNDTLNIPTASSMLTGSIRWMAPEVLDPESAGIDRVTALLESDVYSFAMVMWEIFTGSVPFVDLVRDVTVINRILRGTRPQRLLEATEQGLSDGVWGLMQQCWQTSYADRPTMNTILAQLKSFFNTNSTSVQVSYMESHGFRCNACNKYIIDVRYQCASCTSMPSPFSLCSSCEERSYVLHDAMHVFIRFPRPVDRPLRIDRPLLPRLYKYPAGPRDRSYNPDDPEGYLADLLHIFARCDRCVDRIHGQWFRCGYCSMDLCETCHRKDKHNDVHAFVVFKSLLDITLFSNFSPDVENPQPIIPYPVYHS